MNRQNSSGWPDIPGLDVAAGLASVGRNQATYRRLLAMLVERHDDDPAQIRRALAAGEREEARRVAHSLKGACAALGAEEVRGAALAVEIALRQGDDATDVGKALDNLAPRLAALLDALRPVVQAESPAVPQPPTELGHLLERLESLLAVDDMQAESLWREHAAAFEQALGSHAPAIRQAIEQFDFPAALRGLRGRKDGAGRA